MNFDMTKPCNDCPFRKEGGIPLTRGRIREIAGAMLSTQGGTFACHKTVDYSRENDEMDAGHVPSEGEHHCAGALIFSEKHETATQAMRIAERLGMYDHRKLDRAEFPKIWGSLSQWLKAALPSGRSAATHRMERERD